MSETPSAYQIGGNHYTRLAVQPWDALRAWLGEEGYRAYLRGNAVKYLARAGTKGPIQEDLLKARHYLDALLSSYREPPI